MHRGTPILITSIALVAADPELAWTGIACAASRPEIDRGHLRVAMRRR